MQGTTENCLLTILIERSAHPLTAPLPSLLSPESGRFAPRRPGDQPPGPPLGHPTDSCPTAEFTGPPCIIVITWPKRQAPPPPPTHTRHTHQTLERLEREALGVLQVVHQPAGRGDHHVRLLGQHQALRHHVHAAHDDATLDADRCSCHARREGRGLNHNGALQRAAPGSPVFR